MADDLDLESWLEAPYKNDSALKVSLDPVTKYEENHKDTEVKADNKERESEKGRDRERNREKDRECGHRGGDRRRDRSRSSTRHRSSRHRSRSREFRHPGSRAPRSDSKSSRRYGDRPIDRRGDRRERSSERRFNRSPVKPRSPSPEVSELDRDQRTVFCIQLAARLTNRELREFFSPAGKVRNAKIVFDRNSRRSKGVGYVEFYNVASVQPAIALTGQKLLGIPIIVQESEAEKNRYAEANSVYSAAPKAFQVPNHRLHVANLPLNLTSEELRATFEPFGVLDHLELPIDHTTGRSKGYSFVTFKNMDDAKAALSQMNGMELGGRAIKVSLVSERPTTSYVSHSLDDPESGMVLNSSARADLMKKLARRVDMGVPAEPRAPVIVPSRCVLLENMFDPATETEDDWVHALEDEVEDECQKFGKVKHIRLEEKTKGQIYLKFDSILSAKNAVLGLNGRWFGGRQVLAQYLTESVYNARYPKASAL